MRPQASVFDDIGKPSEGQIERYLGRRVQALGGKALKFVSPGFSGVPDRMILLPGERVVFAELKAPGKSPRKIQVAAHKVFESFGFKVFPAVDSYARADEVAEYCARRMRSDDGL